MSEPVGPGDEVVCVDASGERLSGAPVPLREGATYAVERVWVLSDERDGSWGVAYDLFGVPRGEGDLAYNADRFRPIADQAKPSRQVERVVSR